MFIHAHISKAAFMLQWQSWVIVIETVWPTQPKILFSGPLQKKFADASLEYEFFPNQV